MRYGELKQTVFYVRSELKKVNFPLLFSLFADVTKVKRGITLAFQLSRITRPLYALKSFGKV